MANAPTKTTTIVGDQPITVDGARPTYWFLNFLQRLSSFVGQPATSGTTVGKSLSSSVSTLASEVTTLQAQVALGSTAGDEGHQALQLATRLRARIDQPQARSLPSVTIQAPVVQRPAVTVQAPVIQRPAVQVVQPISIVTLANGARIMDGYGTPEGVIFGSPADQWLRRDGGAGTCLYVKETGVNTNTGWVAK